MDKIELQSLKLDKRYSVLKELSGKEFNKIKQFIEKSKEGENNKGINISDSTERKYIDALSMAYRVTKEPLIKLSKDKLKQLKEDLKSGKIKSRLNKKYSDSSQREMELILIRFLEYLDPEKFNGLRKLFIVRLKRKDVEYLKEVEIEKLYKYCKNNEQRFLIAVLFDSGARASEFLNIRYEDITEPTKDFPYYKINLKEEYSKTKGRNIGLYWKYSTEAIRDYLKDIGELKSKEPIFNKSYDSIRFFLTELGKKVLDKRIHFHIFRKSSASYYATKLKSRQQLCYRYGWNFSSNVPDVYINREQGEEQVKNDILNTDLEKIEKENKELKMIVNINEEKNQKQIEQLTLNFKAFQYQVYKDSKMKSQLNIMDDMLNFDKLPLEEQNKIIDRAKEEHKKDMINEEVFNKQMKELEIEARRKGLIKEPKLKVIDDNNSSLEPQQSI